MTEARLDARGTVYVVIESEWKSGDVGGCLLLDSGEVKWSHMSSGRGWLQRDLTSGFTDRRTELERLYPSGYYSAKGRRRESALPARRAPSD